MVVVKEGVEETSVPSEDSLGNNNHRVNQESR